MLILGKAGTHDSNNMDIEDGLLLLPGNSRIVRTIKIRAMAYLGEN